METKAFITFDDFSEALQGKGAYHFVDLFGKEGQPVPKDVLSKIYIASKFPETFYDSGEESQKMLEGFWQGVTLMIWWDLERAGYVVPTIDLTAQKDITFPVLVTVRTAEGLTRQEFYGRPTPLFKFPVEAEVVFEMLIDYAGKKGKLDTMHQMCFFNWAYTFNMLSTEQREKSGIVVLFQKKAPQRN